MHQYSKEFWDLCRTIPNPESTLSQDVDSRLKAHAIVIRAFCDGKAIEYYSDEVQRFVPLPSLTCGFHPTVQFRVALPPYTERDVVVFYRDAYKSGPYERRAGIDVRLLGPEGISDKANTLADLEKEVVGFKLLSITRVVIDHTNHNLLEHTTKLNNLAYLSS